MDSCIQYRHSVDMDISMDIHRESVDMDMDMDGKFHIHGKPVDNASSDAVSTSRHWIQAVHKEYWTENVQLTKTGSSLFSLRYQ